MYVYDGGDHGEGERSEAIHKLDVARTSRAFDN